MDPIRPKYQKIKHLLSGLIADGDIDHRVPSENELARRYRVSRMTARKALNELLRDGWVERIPGKGTYVRKRQTTQAYFHVHAFSENAKRSGGQTRTQLLRSEVVNLPAALADKLPGRQAVYLCRVHYLANQPVCYETRFLRKDWCAAILEEDLEANSVHTLLIDKLALPISRVWQRLEAVSLERTIASVLKTTPAAPVFCMKQLIFTAEAPVSYVEYFLRSDVYAFEDSFAPNRMHAGGWTGNRCFSLTDPDRS